MASVPRTLRLVLTETFKESIIVKHTAAGTLSLRPMVIAMLTMFVGFSPITVAQDRQPDQSSQTQSSDETVSFFETNTVTELKLTIDHEGCESLRQSPRDYTRSGLVEKRSHHVQASRGKA